MDFSNVKVGDNVYLRCSDTRNTPINTQVDKVGRKYFYTLYGTFEKSTGKITEYPHHWQAYHSEDEYRAIAEKEEKRRKLGLELKHKIEFLTLSQLQRIQQIVNEK